MLYRTLLLAILAICCVGPLSARSAFGDESAAARLFPASTVLYAEIPRPREVVGLVLNHPLRSRVESLEGVAEALRGKEYLQFRAVLAVVEAKLDAQWPEMLSAIAGEGLYIGLDAESEGLVVLAASQDETFAPRAVSTLVELARQDARGKGNPDPVDTAEYRGFQAYALGEAKVAIFGKWLLVTNKPKLGKAIIDRFLDEGGPSLAARESFLTPRNHAPGTATAWVYVDIAALRSAGVAKPLMSGEKTDNFFAELLLGGILSNLHKTPHATARLRLDQRQARLELATPHESDWVSEAREHFFGPQSEGAAPELLAVEDAVFSLSAYRNIAQMWLMAGDLFDEGVNDGLAQADSTLSTFFSGKDFGEDILGAVEPQVQLVVAQQKFAEDRPQPAIKLPAFALAFTLKEPDVMRPELRRIFQSLVGFLNVIGAMNGQPQLDLDMEREGDLQLVTAGYLSGFDGDPQQAPIQYNFSPTVAFLSNRWIVSSSRDLAHKLAQGLLLPAAGDASKETNTQAAANFQVLRDILEDNRRHLVAQNMLEEGHSQEEAEKQIGILLTLLEMLHDADLELHTDSTSLRLSLDVNLVSGP